VDCDEIDSLLDSINYLNKISCDVTPLASFEASYSTKSGFRVVPTASEDREPSRRHWSMAMISRFC